MHQDYMNRSTEKFKNGDVDGAIQDIDTAIEMEPPYLASLYAKRAMYKQFKAENLQDAVSAAMDCGIATCFNPSPMAAMAIGSTMSLLSRSLSISPDWASPQNLLTEWNFWRCTSDEDILRVIRAVPNYLREACLPQQDQHPALHAAIGADRSEAIISEILKLSPGLNFPNLNGNTPLHIAAQRCTRLEVVRLLLDQGADPACLNQKRLTPIQSGQEHGGNQEVLAVMVDDFQNWRDHISDGVTFFYIPVRLAAYNGVWVTLKGNIPEPQRDYVKVVEYPPSGATVLDVQSNTTYPAPVQVTVALAQRRKVEELLRIVEPSTYYPLQAAALYLPTGEPCFLITKDMTCSPVERALLDYGLGYQGEVILKLDQEDVELLKTRGIPFFNISGERI